MDLIYVSGQSFLNADLRKSTNAIRQAGDGIRKNYLKIAHELSMIDKEETYLDDDFESVIEYAEKVFSIKKSTAYNLIQIGSEWLTEDGKRTILTTEGADFSISQLGAMLPAGVEKCKKLVSSGEITPSMSVRSIKKVLADDTEEPDDTKEPDYTEENVVSLGVEKQIIFTESGEIRYCGEFPVWFCDKIGELYLAVLDGEEPV